MLNPCKNKPILKKTSVTDRDRQADGRVEFMELFCRARGAKSTTKK